MLQDAFISEVLPAVVTLVATALALALAIATAYLTKTAKEKWGVEIEATHRDAFHSALKSAVADLFNPVGPDTAMQKVQSAEVRQTLFRRARESVPEAVRGIKGLGEVATGVVSAASPLLDPVDRLIVRFALDRLAEFRAARK